MSRNRVRFTVEEVLAHLDGGFDIPDEGVNSDVEWLEDEDFEEGELILPADSVVLPEEEEEEINLRTVQIEETDDSEEEVAKGRPSNVTVEELSWSDNRTEIDVPGFSQAVGPTMILPVGTLALDFFLLFMSNRILQNILRETNGYASQTLQAKNKDTTTWKQLSMEELKAFFGLLVAMSIHKLPCLRDYRKPNRKQKDGTLQRITYPQLISSYNTHMGGVDKNDQMKSYYTIPVSGKKWWSRILFDLVDRSIFNSFVLDLAKQLIGDFSSRRKRGRPSDEPLSLRNVERHFPDYLPTNESGKRKERRCKVCFDSGVRKMTSYFCPDCDVGLCAAPCFRTYHQ